MTRKDKSKLLVLVTGALVFVAASVFAGMEDTGPRRSDAAAGSRPGTAGPVEGAPDTTEGAGDTTAVATGRELFRTVGCTACHSAEGVGNDRIPLEGVGARLSADTLRAWIVDPRSMDPGVRKPAYDDLPEDEVDALVAYMESLTEPGGG